MLYYKNILNSKKFLCYLIILNNILRFLISYSVFPKSHMTQMTTESFLCKNFAIDCNIDFWLNYMMKLWNIPMHREYTWLCQVYVFILCWLWWVTLIQSKRFPTRHTHILSAIYHCCYIVILYSLSFYSIYFYL